MTWQGGKPSRHPTAPPIEFARLRQLAMGASPKLEDSFHSLSKALSDYGSKVRLHLHLVSGEGKVDHWEVEGGSSKPSAKHARPKSADVHVVLRPETWNQIATGLLAPYDALLGGRLRVGGNLETAKAITKHLSDPAVPYIPPC